MESTTNTVEDQLIDGLQFRLPAGASYITDRKSVSFFPHGGNDYKPSGVKVIKFVLTGNDWLDPSTVKFQFQVNNTATPGALIALPNGVNTMRPILLPLSGPFCFFRRMRVLCQGQTIEDIDIYNRVHNMFHRLSAKHVKDNEAVEGFEWTVDDDLFDPNISISAVNTTGQMVLNWMNNPKPTGLGANESKIVSFKPLAGILNQSKLLPLKVAPLTFEFELVGTPDEAVAHGIDNLEANDPFLTGNVSKEWSLSDVQMKCDLLTLDNGLDNEYTQHLLQGKALSINYSTFISSMQVIAGAVSSVNISRSVSRLKSIFVTYDGYHAADSFGFFKEVNDMYHPMKGYRYDAKKELEYQIQIGSKLFPVYPVRSLAEAFSQLKKTLGIQQTNFHSIDINMKQYMHNHFIIACDTEKQLSAGFTGLNTKNGDLITIKTKSMSGIPADHPTRIYVTLHSDNVLNIRDSGVDVLD